MALEQDLPRWTFHTQRYTFTGEEIIIPPILRNPTSQDFFKLHIAYGIIDRIVTETNLYAEQFIEKKHGNLRPHSLVHQRKPTDRGEMLSLLGIMIMIGIIYKPRILIYWSTDTLLSAPVSSQIKKRDRYLCLIYFVHFSDNKKHNPADPERGRLYTLKEIINMVTNAALRCIHLGKSNSGSKSSSFQREN